MKTEVGAPREVRCVHRRSDGRLGLECRRLLAEGFAGYLRIKCEKCKTMATAITFGRTEIPDDEGVIVVTVTKEARPA